MAQAVRDYGRTLILPPEDAYRLMDVVEVSNTVALQWSVGMPLWTREEGRSDLTVEVTLVAEGQDFRIEIDDIHVL